MYPKAYCCRRELTHRYAILSQCTTTPTVVASARVGHVYVIGTEAGFFFRSRVQDSHDNGLLEHYEARHHL